MTLPAHAIALSRQPASSAASSTSTGFLDPPAFSTGNEYVDHGTACSPPDPHHDVWQHYVHDHCFLAPSQRERKANEFQLRVIDAKDAYLHALEELRVDELLKPEPTSSTWILELLLDVIGQVALSSVMRSFEALRSGGVEALEEVTADAEAAAAELAKTSSKGVETSVKQAITTGKKLVPTATSQAKGKKTENVAFLEGLKNSATLRFQYFREHALAGTTDAQLLVLDAAFAADNGHTIADYKRELSDKLQRFERAHLGKLGIAFNDGEVGVFPAKHRGFGVDAEVETKAFWVELPIGKRLALYHRGHRELPEAGERSCELSVCDRPSARDVEAMRRADLEERPFQFGNFVPADLVETALQMHESRWGEKPSTHAAGPGELMAAPWVSL